MIIGTASRPLAIVLRLYVASSDIVIVLGEEAPPEIDILDLVCGSPLDFRDEYHDFSLLEPDYKERQTWKRRRIDEKKIKHPKWAMNKPKHRR